MHGRHHGQLVLRAASGRPGRARSAGARCPARWSARRAAAPAAAGPAPGRARPAAARRPRGPAGGAVGQLDELQPVAASARRRPGRRPSRCRSGAGGAYGPSATSSRTVMPSGTSGRCGISATTRATRRRGAVPGSSAADPQRATCRDQARHGVQQRGLAGAVGADQATQSPGATTRSTSVTTSTPPRSTDTCRHATTGATGRLTGTPLCAPQHDQEERRARPWRSRPRSGSPPAPAPCGRRRRQSTRNAAPSSSDSGSRVRWPAPNSSRTACGHHDPDEPDQPAHAHHGGGAQRRGDARARAAPVPGRRPGWPPRRRPRPSRRAPCGGPGSPRTTPRTYGSAITTSDQPSVLSRPSIQE